MTDQPNPFQAPAVDDPHHADDGGLASRWARLGAAVIDGLLSIGYAIPLLIYLADFQFGKPIVTSLGQRLQLAIAGVACFLLLHGYLLATRGQTIGKAAAGVRIVGLDGRLLPLGELLLKRYAPLWVLSSVPVMNWVALVDNLFIFRKDRRCLHDLIAGTRVVRIRPPGPVSVEPLKRL